MHWWTLRFLSRKHATDVVDKRDIILFLYHTFIFSIIFSILDIKIKCNISIKYVLTVYFICLSQNTQNMD